MQIKFIFLTLAVFLLMAQIAAAVMIIPANDAAQDAAPAPVKSPVIGDNWQLERVDFIHYVKPPAAAAQPSSKNCYKLTRSMWRSLPVSYVINPANPQGLSESFVTSSLGASAETWDLASSAELFKDTYTVDYAAKYGEQDYQNSIAFGDYPDNGVIAVTSIWSVVSTKQIVEFDMLFNTKFNWGDAASDPSKMDLINIATHEMGHAVGLADIYLTSCSEVTEYGYSAYGETNKRTLELSDITGLQKIYGP